MKQLKNQTDAKNPILPALIFIIFILIPVKRAPMSFVVRFLNNLVPLRNAFGLSCSSDAERESFLLNQAKQDDQC
ncbi:hypothetical protein V6N11_080698 [Hibiscus sabdariffa]|uniref:Uncharacterized protein n=1 Tax=Hibiscus sabdariffa TaxID=183260 RepID=A0ABR2QHW5_9ROSI